MAKSIKAVKTPKSEKALPTLPKAKVKAAVEKRQVVKVEAARHATPATKIEWLVKNNPKRPNSASKLRADAYWGKGTVGEYLAAGATRLDLCWDADHGFLALK
jgi:hypothetical protein